MSENKKNDTKQNRLRTAAVIVVIICVVAAALVLFGKPASDAGKGNHIDSTTAAVSGTDDKSNQETGENESVEIVEETGTVEIIKKADASYEKWLSAAMVLGISMQYEDFAIDKIYLTGETDTASKGDSQGAYVIFTLNDEKVVLESRPLDAERTDAGTIDLYTKDLGFATFDTVSVDSLDIEAYQEITMDDLKELISQSLLVSLYEH